LRRIATLAAVVAVVATAFVARSAAAIEIGAIYPTGGSHGRGGQDEWRGASMAAEYVNARGGVNGRPVRLVLEPAESSDQAPGAVRRLAARGVPAIVGSYGSTISAPAAGEASRAGIVFFETGAVGKLSMAATDTDLVFRFPPTGAHLGSAAVAFARDQLMPVMKRDPRSLRYAVTYVDDVYGRAVGDGAADEIRRDGLTLAGVFPYVVGGDYAALVRRIAASRADVLLVSAYLQDGIAIRKETVAQRLPLLASVGTSSSYCMHEFGAALGDAAVGLFASDKPDGHVLDPTRLTPQAAEALQWSRDEFERRYDHEMTAAALTGFSGTFALLAHALPAAAALTPAGIADALRATRIEQGALPNGSGMGFEAGSSQNLLATSVIWQWTAPFTRTVVWPPQFATGSILPLPIA